MLQGEKTKGGCYSIAHILQEKENVDCKTLQCFWCVTDTGKLSSYENATINSVWICYSLSRFAAKKINNIKCLIT